MDTVRILTVRRLYSFRVAAFYDENRGVLSCVPPRHMHMATDGSGYYATTKRA